MKWISMNYDYNIITQNNYIFIVPSVTWQHFLSYSTNILIVLIEHVGIMNIAQCTYLHNDKYKMFVILL